MRPELVVALLLLVAGVGVLLHAANAEIFAERRNNKIESMARATGVLKGGRHG